MIDVSLAVALGAGLLSFLSPCVLPLIPGYLSFISGTGVDELRSGARRGGVFLRTLFFVLGFTAVFVGLGLAFSGGGMLTSGRSNRIVSIVAGSFIALLGVNVAFDFIKLLNFEARVRVASGPSSAAGAFFVGMAFGAGWTPCVGPILASILFMAARSGGAGRAAMLLATYSAGLALPFLAAGLFFDRLAPVWSWFKRHGRGVRLASGLLLVAIGASMALGRLTALNAATARLGISLKAFAAASPAEARAWTSGVIALLAAAVVAWPLLRGKRLATPPRLAALAVLAAALALEALGVVSFEGILSDWLLFQGV